MILRLFKKILQHKVIAGIIVLLITSGGYFGYQNLLSKKNKNEVQYAMASVKKGTLVVSVSGSGQVSTSDQTDISPKSLW